MKTIKRSRDAAHAAPMLNLAEEAGEDIESLREEMQEWYDNMPESLQGGEKGSNVESCASELGSLKDDIDTWVGVIEKLPEHLRSFDVNYTQDERRAASSRAGRLGNAGSKIDAIHTVVMDLIALPEHAEYKAALEDVLEDAEGFQNLLGNVSFPGMYG